MSRSRWAWTESCGQVSTAMCTAGRLVTHEVQTRLGSERSRTVSSLTRLTWVTTVMMFVLALSSAAALGQAGTPHSGASVAPATGGASPHGITSSATPNPDPKHARDASADGRTSNREVLAIGSGYSNDNGSTRVKALQRRLIGLGYSPGPLDGRYGPLTEGAVIRFQAAHGLKVDGIAGSLTLAALASAQRVLYPGEGYAPGGSPPVRRLQRLLAAAGYPPGAIDGRYGPLTVRAVKRFQVAHHLHSDGIAGPQTAGRLETALRARVHHQTRPVPPAPVTSHHPSRPVPTAAGRARSHRRAVSPQLHRVSRSPGSLSTLWIILAGCVIAGVLAAMLWRLRPRGGKSLPATEPRPGSNGAPVLGVGHAAGSREELSDLTVPAVGPRKPPAVGPPERAAQLPAAGPGGHQKDQQVGAAAFSRGLKLARDGDLVGAEDAFRQSDEHGNAGAACNLGVLLEQRGDLAGARHAYQRADERGLAEGACNLGALLESEGNVDGAEVAYRRADQRGDANGAANLGVLLQGRGDLTGAEAAYRRASERGHAAAASNLGVLLEQRGDLAGARDAYQRADERGHAEGACNLGALLEYQGDVVGARDAYRRADERGDPVGARSLGRLLADQGDRVGAKKAFERADRRGHPDAAFYLGVLLLQEGDRPRALEALQRAGERGSDEIAEVANAAVLELSGREGER